VFGKDIMIPTAFEYHTAGTVDEALHLLDQHGDDAKLLAGGHSLIPMMKLRLASPKHVVDIGGIAAMRGIRHGAAGDDAHIVIGALTTHAEVASSEMLARECPLLRETAAEIGDVQVRNRGTIGGSLAHFDPAADYPAAILALDAEIVARGRSGDRHIPAASFFTDTFQTALASGEILTAVRVPVQPAHCGSAYVKVHHPASGYAVVGVAVRLMIERGVIHRAHIGVTGLGHKAYRAARAERELEGKHPEAAVLRAAAAHVAEGVEPLSDVYASGEYRCELARVHARRAIERAVTRAKA
jgi:aerobic carbon-monoxide dehydrogenase medium subunit